MGRIVVGVDGSEHAQRALQWAVEEARLRRCDVEAVYVYEYTPAWQHYGYGEEFVDEQAAERVRQVVEEHARRAAQAAEALAERVVAGADTEGVAVEPVAVHNRRPANALVERSTGTDLLVVGSRGRGGFAGLVLGSVSQQCAQHARCPVVILRQAA